MSEEKKLTAILEFDKDTKNTMRYTEEFDAPPIIGTVYVQKWALKKLGQPQRIRVTIEAVED